VRAEPLEPLSVDKIQSERDSGLACDGRVVKKLGPVCRQNPIRAGFRPLQAAIRFPVSDPRAAHPARLKHGQGIAPSRLGSKLPPIHVSKPSSEPQLQEVRVFSPHGLQSFDTILRLGCLHAGLFRGHEFAFRHIGHVDAAVPERLSEVVPEVI